MAVFGDKLTARQAAREAGLNVLPGSDQPISGSQGHALRDDNLTFPLLVKAAAGGGGKGIRLARSIEELTEVIDLARDEAFAAFGNGTIYLEPLVQKARHIEVQIMGDGNGNVLTFGERECSIQRRHQKLIEEAPASEITPEERSCIIAAAHQLGSNLNYRSLGTVEFLMDEDRQFYFIEVNPRIQVEHPVTEMVTGTDLIRAQIQLAETGELNLTQSDITYQGAAIEARILAEDPDQDFMPTTGEVSYLKEPGGPGVRVDSSLYQGMTITPEYDSLISKVVAWGSDRKMAIQRLRRALKEYQIGGLKTDLQFLSQILESHPYQAGKVNTTFLEEFSPEEYSPEESLTRDVAIATALHIHRRRTGKLDQEKNDFNLWRQKAWREQIKTKD
jgi:acetyl-CoA carboxylase biotin carboxylase subunit